MPVIKSAVKKLRKDKKRELVNKKIRNSLKTVVKIALKTKTVQSVNSAIKTIDKATKNKIIHKNKAARLKSRLSKLVAKKPVKEEAAKPAKKAKKSSKKS